MAKETNIIIENKLVLEKRDLSVYHHFARSAHMISFNRMYSLYLRAVLEDDYLHVAIVSGPGDLKGNCIVNMPSWIDFEFSLGSDISVNHVGDCTILKIPPGLPRWQLRLTRSPDTGGGEPGRVIIGDDQVLFSGQT